MTIQRATKMMTGAQAEYAGGATVVGLGGHQRQPGWSAASASNRRVNLIGGLVRVGGFGLGFAGDFEDIPPLR